MKEIIVSENEQDKRFDRFLKGYLKEASGGFIYKMLRKKNITLNDKKADGMEKLKKGDVIKIFVGNGIAVLIDNSFEDRLITGINADVLAFQ